MRELLGLRVHEVLPPAALVLLDRLAPLLDGAADGRLDLFVGQLALGLDALVLQAPRAAAAGSRRGACRPLFSARLQVCFEARQHGKRLSPRRMAISLSTA